MAVAPSAGVVTGLGRVSGRLCMIVANDATVKAGAFFPMRAAKKVIRARAIALDPGYPGAELNRLKYLWYNATSLGAVAARLASVAAAKVGVGA